MATSTVWPMRQLKEITSTIGSGATPRGGKNVYKLEGTSLIRSLNVHDFSFSETALAFIDGKQAGELDNVTVQKDDILLNITGASVARCCMVNPKHLPARVNQHVAIVRVCPSEAEAKFVFYTINSPHHKSRLLALAQGGATREALTKKTIEEFDIPLPPLPMQRRIAGILSAYDELIEKNQRRIQILETMARALYREWFVEFRFPGHDKISRVASPLGDIPQGWEARTLGQIAENFDRRRRPLSKMQRAEMQGEYPYYGAAKVFDYVNDFIFDGEYLLMAEDGSVITPERAPVLQLVNEKFWPNNHTHVLRGKPPFSTHFLYLGLSEVDISSCITGAAQPKITQENMNRIPFFCGPKELHQHFDRLVAPMVRHGQSLQRLIKNLRQTRDLLLPRLLSGQVALTDTAA